MKAASRRIQAAQIYAATFLLLLIASGCSTAPQRRPHYSAARPPGTEVGVASYYGAQYHGRKTASGETFNMRALSAAHRTHAFGTRVRVTHLGNNRSVVVRINDRGPFVKGRIIDLSQAAARELGMVQSGWARVKVEVVEMERASAK